MIIDNMIEFFGRLGAVISSITFVDILDVAFVTFIIYQAVKLIRDTRAIQLFKGIIIVGVIFAVVKIIDAKASSYLFSKLFADVILFMIILFQPEIRHAIEHMGRGWGLSIFSHSVSETDSDTQRIAIIEIAKACQRMSNSRTGSIIILERKSLLGDIIKTGINTDSKITHELIGNIFFPNAPLHDGAAIVRDSRLIAAGCVLPLTDNPDIPSDLGMRHRAAIGVTEQSDAIAIITSEETGVISICCNGNIIRGFDEASLREKLFEMCKTEEDIEKPKGLFSTIKNFFARKNK